VYAISDDVKPDQIAAWRWKTFYGAAIIFMSDAGSSLLQA
jgi:hypothetical protein